MSGHLRERAGFIIPGRPSPVLFSISPISTPILLSTTQFEKKSIKRAIMASYLVTPPASTAQPTSRDEYVPLSPAAVALANINKTALAPPTRRP